MAPPGIRMLTGGDLALPEGYGTLPPQPRALLVALLLKAETDVSRDWLADLIWPETDQQTARRRLRMTLLGLRSALGGADWARIEATRSALRLEVGPLQIDVFQFKHAAGSDHPDTRAMACDLYAGDLLARFPAISSEFDRFLDDHRTALRSVAVSLLLEMMRAARDRGDASSFERVFQKLVQIDPVNDAAARLAIETWAETGQMERIQVEYRRFCSAYAEAFDAPPPEAVPTAYRKAVGSASRAPMSRQHREHGVAALSKQYEKTPASKSKQSRTLQAVILALACVTGLAWAIRELRPPSTGPVILLREAELSELGCTIPNAAARYRQEIRDGLEGIAGASVVVGPVGGALARAGDSVFDLWQIVTCQGELLRATLTLSRPKGGAALWIGRFEANLMELDGLSDRLQFELAPVLDGRADRSGIRKDWASSVNSLPSALGSEPSFAAQRPEKTD